MAEEYNFIDTKNDKSDDGPGTFREICMNQNIEQIIREFLCREILLDETAEIKSDTNLFQSGILDSQGLIILVGFLERKFNIEISAEDLAGNNLTSLSNIEALVCKRGS